MGKATSHVNAVLHRLYLTLPVFEQHAGFIWSLNFQEAQAMLANKPNGTCLWRSSSQSNRVATGLQVFVFCSRDRYQTLQTRFVNIVGVGWYSVDGDGLLDVDVIIAQYGAPLAARFIDLLELLVKTGKFNRGMILQQDLTARQEANLVHQPYSHGFY